MFKWKKQHSMYIYVIIIPISKVFFIGTDSFKSNFLHYRVLAINDIST